MYYAHNTFKQSHKENSKALEGAAKCVGRGLRIKAQSVVVGGQWLFLHRLWVGMESVISARVFMQEAYSCVGRRKAGALWGWLESAKEAAVLIDSPGGAGLGLGTVGSVDCSGDSR